MKQRALFEPVRLFVSYSHHNKLWFLRLHPVLQFEWKASIAHVWHDQELKAGSQWDKEIRRELESMDIFVCLVSYEFLASSYIKDVELPRALNRWKTGSVEIVPVLLFPVSLEIELPQLAEFSPLPAYDRSWSSFEENNGHFQNAHQLIRNGLWSAIERVQDKREQKTAVSVRPRGKPKPAPRRHPARA